MLAVAGRARGIAGQAGLAYPAYSLKDSETVPEYGGGNLPVLSLFVLEFV